MIESSRLPTLHAERVRLRWLEPRDVVALFEVFSDRETMRFWSSPAMTNPDEAEALWAEINACFLQRTLFQWGIARVEDDVVIGTCTLAQVTAAHRRAEIGFALGSAHWGQGFAREAVGRLVAYAFDDLALHRLEADADPRNLRSIALLERVGFVQEGYARERWHVGDEIADGVLFGLLARDWLAARPETAHGRARKGP